MTVAAPCVQVTPAQLDFGTLGLSPDVSSLVSASSDVSVVNCGPSSQNILARGTNASSTGGTTWTLEPNLSQMCSGPHRFGQRIDTGALSIPLSTTDASVSPVAGGATASWRARVVMPCTGSSGAGQVTTFSYVFTAVLP